MEPEKETSSPARSPLWRAAFLGILVSFIAIMSKKKRNVTPNADKESAKKGEQSNPPITATSTPNPQGQPFHCQITCKQEKDWWDKAKPFVEVAGAIFLAVYTFYTIKMYCANKKAADAAKSAADTAASQLVLTERPWIKITHRIVTPLTFDVPGNGGQIDSMTLEDTLENVGQSIALHIFSWEDVIPMDNGSSPFVTARARQDQWCDTNRHRDVTKGLSGYVLFPKDHFSQNSRVGGYMTVVNKIARENKVVPGKVGFVLVGCVAYRSSFEPVDAPAHETKFIYQLAEPLHGVMEGAVQPFVSPAGTANGLQLVIFPDGFSAD